MPAQAGRKDSFARDCGSAPLLRKRADPNLSRQKARKRVDENHAQGWGVSLMNTILRLVL
jgi:hypothetical protein